LIKLTQKSQNILKNLNKIVATRKIHFSVEKIALQSQTVLEIKDIHEVKGNSLICWHSKNVFSHQNVQRKNLKRLSIDKTVQAFNVIDFN
jgi:hypothetical protein